MSVETPIPPAPAASSAAAPAQAREPLTAARVAAGMRKGENWAQLGKFLAVGASGYVVNLAVFAASSALLDLHHLLAATVAFLVAVTNNFVWNRRWTFAAQAGLRHTQAVRFFVVSVGAFLCGAVLLELLVSRAGVPELAAQAIAIVGATPVGFLGNRAWTFRA